MRSWFSLISILASASSALAQPPTAAAPTTLQREALRRSLTARPAHIVAVPSDALKAEPVKPAPPAAAAPIPAPPRLGVLYKLQLPHE
jgi:hypothetical protein